MPRTCELSTNNKTSVGQYCKRCETYITERRTYCIHSKSLRFFRSVATRALNVSCFPFAIDNFPRRLRPVIRIYQEHTPKNAQIWSFESQANILICCQQTSDFMAKMRWIQFQLELSSRPHWGSLVLLQTLLLDLRGPTSKGGKGK